MIRSLVGLTQASSRLLAVKRASNSVVSFCSTQTDEELDTLYKKLFLEIKAHDPTVLDAYEKFVKLAALELDVEYVKSERPWRHIIRRPLLRSVFIYKDHREFYEFRTYYLNMEFKNMTGSTMDTFLEYIERNLPEAVAMTVTKTALSNLPEHLNRQEAVQATPSS